MTAKQTASTSLGQDSTQTQAATNQPTSAVSIRQARSMNLGHKVPAANNWSRCSVQPSGYSVRAVREHEAPRPVFVQVTSSISGEKRACTSRPSECQAAGQATRDEIEALFAEAGAPETHPATGLLNLEPSIRQHKAEPYKPGASCPPR